MPIVINDEKIVGTIIAGMSNSLPVGYLKCNGAAISRTAFVSLFTIIGTTYGAGDGSTTFNLPDLRGEFLRGLDDSRGIDISRSLGSAQSAQNLSHSHTVNSHNHGGGSHAHSFGVKQGGYSNSMWHWNGGTPSGSDSVPDSSAGTNASSVISSESPGTNSDGGSDLRPRNMAVNYFIKF
jgi:microcystin-dependent protein